MTDIIFKKDLERTIAMFAEFANQIEKFCVAYDQIEVKHPDPQIEAWISASLAKWAKEHKEPLNQAISRAQTGIDYLQLLYMNIVPPYTWKTELRKEE